MFYSKSTNGFYTLEIQGANIPQDAVEITDELYTALFEGQANGKKISANAEGFPELIDMPVEPTPAIDPVQKLKTFLAMNPDVATLLS